MFKFNVSIITVRLMSKSLFVYIKNCNEFYNKNFLKFFFYLKNINVFRKLEILNFITVMIVRTNFKNWINFFDI